MDSFELTIYTTIVSVTGLYATIPVGMRSVVRAGVELSPTFGIVRD
jgi:hypothetical protein